MNAIWDFLRKISEEIDDEIKENIKYNFIRGLASSIFFLVKIAVVIGIPALMLLLSIPKSPIYKSIWFAIIFVIIILFIEIMIYIGKKSKKKTFNVDIKRD